MDVHFFNLLLPKGVTTYFKNDGRPQLLIVHCVSHRLELAIKDAYNCEDSFKDVSDTMFSLWNAFRHSGKLKRLLKQVASQLNVKVVAWVKSNGTRFQNHMVINNCSAFEIH